MKNFPSPLFISFSLALSPSSPAKKYRPNSFAALLALFPARHFCSRHLPMGKGQSKQLAREQIRTLARQTHFTEKEILQWHRGFSRDCPNGMLTEVGFQKIYKQFFPQGDPTDFAAHVFRVLDENQDAAIEFPEFVEGLLITSRGSLEQKLGWAFRLYDRDKDGAVTRQEMESFLGGIYKMLGDALQLSSEAEGTPERRTALIWATLGKEADGKLSLDEFTESAKSDANIVQAFSLYEGLGK